MTDVYTFEPGQAPLLISVPHAGTLIPDSVLAGMSEDVTSLPDTDWFVDRLYDFAPRMGIGMIVGRYSRYVIDLNRSPEGEKLYPGRAETELCPTTLFDGTPLYPSGQEPDVQEIENRRRLYWQPYHNKLREELDRLRRQHNKVLLWDAHSIRSQVPRLFDGILPDLNFGTADGASCDPEIAEAVHASARTGENFSTVLNGRFKGGYITRHYGLPDEGFHALQLEIAQSSYMDETRSGPIFDADRSGPLKDLLKRLITVAKIHVFS